MEQLYYSIDIKRYLKRDGDSLFLEGWLVVPGIENIKIAAVDQTGKRLKAETERLERPDIREAMQDISVPEKAGFRLKVSEITGHLEECLEALRLVAYGEGFQRTFAVLKAAEIQALIFEDTILYKVDVLRLLDLELEVQGWLIDQQGTDKIEVLEGKSRMLPCRVRRFAREDVREQYGEYAEEGQKIGFVLTIPREKIRGGRIRIRFKSSRTQKEELIDIRELERRETKGGRIYNVLRPGRLPENIKYIREHDLAGFREYVRSCAMQGTTDYHVWAKRNRLDKRELKRQRTRRFLENPKISIVIPLYHTPQKYLKQILDSVIRQTYTNWELCLADGSREDTVEDFIRANYKKEKRIKYKRLAENRGISENTNAAIAMAEGDYIMLSDHDDIVEQGALYEIVKAVNENPDVDIIYTDEDKMTMDGRRFFQPNFKPDYNPFMLESTNYICHIFVVRSSVLKKAGGFRREFDGAQDYDLILRCCEQTTAERICHIPKALYHWRFHPDSTAARPESKPYAFLAGQKALREHLERKGIRAEVELTDSLGVYRVRRLVEGEPLISIIIPNKDHREDLENCLRSLTERSSYGNYEILVVENNSTEPETFAYYEKMQEQYPCCRFLTWKDEFNYAAINNFAVREAKGDYLLFLNNDVEVITKNWMEEMLGICQLPEVGIVGAKLYYPDDTIQHAGVILGMGGVAGHIFSCAPRYEQSYMWRASLPQNLSAVTAACMMMKRSAFLETGGFDEQLKVAFNDVDLCMKAGAAGYQVVYTPYAELYHYESKSRGAEDTDKKRKRFNREALRFRNKWSSVLKAGDPYYNINLSLEDGNCSFRE